MRRLVLAIALGTALAGCSRGGAAELLETAKLEELQRNLPHARQLYQDIVARYPESSEAEQARQRLTALGAGAVAE